jgi:hypothetical protein
MQRSSEKSDDKRQAEKNKITRMERLNVISLTFRNIKMRTAHLPIFKALQTWPPMAKRRASASPLMRAPILLWPPVLLNSADRTAVGNGLRAEGNFENAICRDYRGVDRHRLGDRKTAA